MTFLVSLGRRMEGSVADGKSSLDSSTNCLSIRYLGISTEKYSGKNLLAGKSADITGSEVYKEISKVLHHLRDKKII